MSTSAYYQHQPLSSSSHHHHNASSRQYQQQPPVVPQQQQLLPTLAHGRTQYILSQDDGGRDVYLVKGKRDPWGRGDEGGVSSNNNNRSAEAEDYEDLLLFAWRVKADPRTGKFFFVNCGGLGKRWRLPDYYDVGFQQEMQLFFMNHPPRKPMTTTPNAGAMPRRTDPLADTVGPSSADHAFEPPLVANGRGAAGGIGSVLVDSTANSSRNPTPTMMFPPPQHPQRGGGGGVGSMSGSGLYDPLDANAEGARRRNELLGGGAGGAATRTPSQTAIGGGVSAPHRTATPIIDERIQAEKERQAAEALLLAQQERDGRTTSATTMTAGADEHSAVFGRGHNGVGTSSGAPTYTPYGSGAAINQQQPHIAIATAAAATASTIDALTAVVNSLQAMLDNERKEKAKLQQQLVEKDRIILERSVADAEADEDDLRLKMKMLEALAARRREDARLKEVAEDERQRREVALRQQMLAKVQRANTIGGAATTPSASPDAHHGSSSYLY